MPEAQENAKIIIAMLDKNSTDMKHLHECMHEVSDEVKTVGVYFAGIQPQVHILDHAKIQEILSDKKEITRAGRHALVSIITSVITAGVLAFSAWAFASVQSDFKHEVLKMLEQRK